MFEKILTQLRFMRSLPIAETAPIGQPKKKSIIRRISHHSKMLVISTMVTIGGQFFMLLVASIAVAMLIFVVYYSKEALEMIAADGKLAQADRGAALIAGIKTVTETIFPVFSVVLVALTTAFAGISYVKKAIMNTSADTQTPPPAAK